MKLLQYLLLAAALSLPISSHAGENPDWQFRVTPYLWAIAIDGRTGPKGHEADVDMSFSDIFDHLDSAFIFNIEASKGPLSTWFDYNAMSLSTKGQAASVEVKLKVDQKIAEAALAYQLPSSDFFELFAGARYVDATTKINFQGSGPVGINNRLEIGDNWVDPFIGLRSTWPISPKWSIRARADIGGFGVGSDFSWQLATTTNYQYSDRVSFHLGYRYLDIDYDDSGFVLNAATSGLMLGVGFTF